MTDATKTYTGGCHCGAIRYSVDLDLSKPEATKCNCSICLKTNRLSLSIQPTQLKLVSPASLSDIPEYQFGSKSQHHRFCDKCGIHVFGGGSYVWEGKEVKNFDVNAVTLDQDQGVDLRKFKVGYWDGKTEGWAKGMSEGPYEGGTF
ncbi:Mss4-like protein [Immersiella caudata]|uniref:Mss4-like protein n=1 Tax=Immersiella caudata TaxID=314043 RepID=A0AA39WK74_9PEZI|nr:Mss4-like protein [Immersiella caudata]